MGYSLPSVDDSLILSFGPTLRVKRLGSQKSIILCALNRPQVKNAFNDEQYRDLTMLLVAVERDESIHAIVLTGTGSYFSSGADLASFDLESEAKTQDKPSGIFMLQLIHFTKLFCAAVNGPAIGIGVTLLLHCDLVYCTQDSTFWTPFTRIALVPEFCSSVLFPETMGLANANELLLMGRQIDAEQALRYNIVGKIIYDCSSIMDPFSKESIASFTCKEIDKKLLSLCHGDKTSRLFVSMVRGRRQKELEKICRFELNEIDKRIEKGDVLEATMDLMMKRSKL
jgi:Delta3-Delta2-enoyl-CoA isomerase